MCERNINPLPLTLETWPTTQACALTRRGTAQVSVHTQAGALSTELYQPGLVVDF